MDREELETLARAHGRALVRFAYVMTGNSEDANDVVQTAFMRMLASKSDIRSPVAYARRAIANEVYGLSARRARQSRFLAVADAAAEELDVPERDRLWKALATLQPRQRAVLVLRHYEDLDDVAISELLGCRRATVRSLAARGLAALREQLTETRTREERSTP